MVSAATSGIKEIWCCGCNTAVDAKLCNGTAIYPHRPDLAHKNFYRCPACRNYVGCHPKSDRPLGNIPTPELRSARGHVHALLDPIWKNGRMSRREIYGSLSKKIGREYHTGEIKTVEEAREIYRLIQGIIADMEKAA